MNPEFLLCDSDALIQILMSRQGGLLARLKSDFGVSAAAVPEVETEIRNHRNFGQEFGPRFKQLVESGTITLFDASEVRSLLAARKHPPAQIAPELARIQAFGEDNERTVGLGEAYVHAAAVVLQLPVLSNDFTALLILGDPRVGCPTLRFFDVLVFGFGQDWITNADGERIVSELKERNEYIPAPFRGHEEFADCCRAFDCRLLYAPAASTPTPPRTFSDPLTLRR